MELFSEFSPLVRFALIHVVGTLLIWAGIVMYQKRKRKGVQSTVGAGQESTVSSSEKGSGEPYGFMGPDYMG